MRTEELDYDFDPALIAMTPAAPRDAARLMLVDRKTGRLTHHLVRDLPQFLGANDTLFVNATSVQRARLSLVRHAEGSTPRLETEGLLLKPVMQKYWQALIRQSKRCNVLDKFALRGSDGEETGDFMLLHARCGEGWIVQIQSELDPQAALDRSGLTPLPPYILKARKNHAISVMDADDRTQYETVYADATQRNSVAAPTAGLHFTPELLDTLARNGVQRAEVHLDVGAGTFKPIDKPTLEEHPMHAEHLEIPVGALEALETATATPPRRRVAVGTTTVRALESLPPDWKARDGTHRAETQLLIQPGFTFRNTDAILTNFHLPRSTLLALVGAFTGMELLKHAYATAVQERYRFYSYGDAMLCV